MICRVSGQTMADALWFGYLDNEGFEQWRGYARQQAEAVGKWLASPTRNGQNQWRDKLFHVTDDVTKSRLGYWYGFEVAESLAGQGKLASLLTCPAHQWREAVADYFRAPAGSERVKTRH